MRIGFAISVFIPNPPIVVARQKARQLGRDEAEHYVRKGPPKRASQQRKIPVVNEINKLRAFKVMSGFETQPPHSLNRGFDAELLRNLA
jgi:hypothetical protein